MKVTVTKHDAHQVVVAEMAIPLKQDGFALSQALLAAMGQLATGYRHDVPPGAGLSGALRTEWPTVVSGTINFIGADEPEPVWGIRRDGDWNHDSLADLIKENTEHDGTCSIQAGTIVWRGLKKFDDPEDFVPGADDIINTMANNAAGSDGGEFADDYPNVTEEAQAELNEYLIAWARKHAPVTGFYGVVDIEQYTVTAEDLAQ